MNVGTLDARLFSAPRAAAMLAAACACAPPIAGAQDTVSSTALTIYSTTRPGAVPAELYRPLPGQGNVYNGQSVPGYAMIRQERAVDLKQGVNRLNFRDVAAYIDPTTVTFESLTAPATRVIEQSFEFDLVSTEKLLEKYVDQVITVDQLTGDRVVPLKGKLLSALGGLVLASDNGEIHAITSYQNVHFPTLPGGLMTKPTLVWDVDAARAGRESTRVTYQTAGITWWADYNLVWTDGADANHGTLDVGAWVSILNRSGTTYGDAKLKLIAGDVNRVQPEQPVPLAARTALFEQSVRKEGFAEQSFFEFHLYTLGRRTTLPDNSTKQLELFDQAKQIPAKKVLVYYGAPMPYAYPSPMTDRNLGSQSNKKVDVYLEFKNDKQFGLGVPLPAGRIRVSQLDKADDSLEFIGEDKIDHTPKDDLVRVKLGSAFDVVGERRQVNFAVDTNAKWLEEEFEIKLRNHKPQAVDVVVKENLYRWSNWKILTKSHNFVKEDARTINFPVRVEKDGQTVVRYKVRYTW
jgi:hypothetical protein